MGLFGNSGFKPVGFMPQAPLLGDPLAGGWNFPPSSAPLLDGKPQAPQRDFLGRAGDRFGQMAKSGELAGVFGALASSTAPPDPPPMHHFRSALGLLEEMKANARRPSQGGSWRPMIPAEQVFSGQGFGNGLNPIFRDGRG